jgi:hypothetical protein
MKDRLELDDILAGIIGITESDGDRHTYYNPPPSVRMRYPAIKYSLSNVASKYANDGVYNVAPTYEAILIDEEVDTQYLIPMLHIPQCKFNRFYIAEGLNHWVFTINNN